MLSNGGFNEFNNFYKMSIRTPLLLVLQYANRGENPCMPKYDERDLSGGSTSEAVLLDRSSSNPRVSWQLYTYSGYVRHQTLHQDKVHFPLFLNKLN